MSETAWKRVRAALPWVAGALFLFAAWSVTRAVRRIGVDEIARALGAIDGSDVAAAAALAAGSYLVLTWFELLAVRTVCNAQPTYSKVALTSFTALSLGHTVGLAALSSGTIRYRFYSHFGMGGGDVARIVVFSGTTVAVGLAGLAGAAGLLRPEMIADFAGVSPGVATGLGVVALLGVVAYVAWTARAGGSVRLRGHTLPVPSARVALLQVALGSANFLLVAATLHRLLGDATDVTLLAFASFYAVGHSIATLSHVPGGLGVLEMVVLAAVPGAEAVGALVAFRLVYYFAPFVVGALVYGLFELLRKRRAAAEDVEPGRASGGSSPLALNGRTEPPPRSRASRPREGGPTRGERAR